MFQELKRKIKKRKRQIHSNIDYLMEKFSLDITSLSMETGVPIATISRMKKEDNNPTISSIEPLAEFFRIDLNDLLYEDLSSMDYQSKKKIGNIQFVPTAKLEEINQWPIQFNPKLYMGTIGNLNNGSFGLLISTDSLTPIFYKNSILIIDPLILPKDGDYVFCLLQEEKIPVIRQIFVDGSNNFFKPINPGYGEMILIKKFQILGVIVKSIENYR